jgi:hypothetical protein
MYGYLDETDLNINNDIITRKEFQLLKPTEAEQKIIPRFLIQDAAEKGNYLDLQAHQLFVRNYLNPNTKYSRLLIKWETGIGKTTGALSIALNFIRYYQKQEEYISKELSIGSVFIIGFTQQIFRNELFKFPEFGFISREELNKLNKIKKNVYSGSLQDIENLKRFNTMLKKRLQSRRGNGFFKFIGYKELTNHLFISKQSLNLHTLTDDELTKLIDEKKITINKELLEMFSNSLLICDEVHNIYNSHEKNNWGTAIQTILNYHKSCRAVFLSATPLNNSPTEVIDLLNLLLPRQYYPVLEKKDFFNDSGIIESKNHELSNFFIGRISFIRNQNPQYMATKFFVGESIPGIDYLKFIRCPMSDFHLRTYKKAIAENNIGQDGYYLLDFVLPDPDNKTPFDTTGMFKSKEIRDKLNSSTPQWKNKVGLSYDYKKDLITGPLLKNKLSIISNKYDKMLSLVLENIKKQKGKMFIYHNNIHTSGTLFIQEIFSQNGIIGEFDNSNDTTVCAICGAIRKAHLKEQLINIKETTEHFYEPARFVIIHSNLDKKQINQSLEKFNNVNNTDGSKFMILIGSRIIKESHSISAVRHIMIMSRPDNISALIQIIGRAVRLNSHKNLPYTHRNVSIRIFTSSIKKELSYEEKKYNEKIETYKIIQTIEKMMHESAIDAYFNYDDIWKKTDEKFELSILPYKKPSSKTFSLDELNLSTFNAYYAKFEVDYITYIIKRLFIEYSVSWKYKDLFAAVQSSPFRVEINTKLISEDLFNIALNNLIYNSSLYYREPVIQKINDTLVDNLLDKVRNPDDKIIMVQNDVQFIITHVGELYIMAPIINNEIVYGAEMLYRNAYVPKPSLLDITEYLKYDMDTNYHNKKIRFINKWRLVSINHLELAICDFGIKFHQQFIEEIIEYIFNTWTSSVSKKYEYHDFYIKMIYYYDLQKLIAWAHTVNNKISKKYSDYIIPVTTKINDKALEKSLGLDAKESSGLINLLVSSINKNDPYWMSTGMLKDYENKLTIINALFDGVYKKTKAVKKINVSAVLFA